MNIFPKLFVRWNTLTLPSFEPSVPREHVLRASLISWFLFITLSLAFLSVPFTLFPFPNPIVLCTLLGIPVFLTSLYLNKRGQTMIAAILCVLATFLATTCPIWGGMGITDPPVLCLLIIPLLVSCAVLPNEVVWIHLCLNLLVIILALFSPLNAKALQLSFQQDPYSYIAPQFALEIVVTCLAYAIVKNLTNALKRAARAQEIAIFQRAVAQQEHTIATQQDEKILGFLLELSRKPSSLHGGLLTSPEFGQLPDSSKMFVTRLQQLQKDSRDLAILQAEIATIVARIRLARMGSHALSLPQSIPPPLEPLFKELALLQFERAVVTAEDGKNDN